MRAVSCTACASVGVLSEPCVHGRSGYLHPITVLEVVSNGAVHSQRELEGIHAPNEILHQLSLDGVLPATRSSLVHGEYIATACLRFARTQQRGCSKVPCCAHATAPKTRVDIPAQHCGNAMPCVCTRGHVPRTRARTPRMVKRLPCSLHNAVAVAAAFDTWPTTATCAWHIPARNRMVEASVLPAALFTYNDKTGERMPYASLLPHAKNLEEKGYTPSVVQWYQIRAALYGCVPPGAKLTKNSGTLFDPMQL